MAMSLPASSLGARRWALLAALSLLGCPGPATTDAGVDAGLLPNTSGWWRNQVFYEVFVRSFSDSNGDGIGDLKGVLARLDQLHAGDAGLGVDGIWLMPIYPSPSYHGYDVIDYQAVNSQYGTLADVDAVVAAAHARGMRVILDFVPNHTSTQHPWFEDSAPDAGHRDWYVWRPGSTLVSHWYQQGSSSYYAYFCGCMPDLNYRTPAVEQAVGDAMIFWLQHGVDGFRIDAARYLVESADFSIYGLTDQPETHQVFQRLRRRLAAVNPQVLLVAEAWEDVGSAAAYYGTGNEFQLAFSFDLAAAIVSSLKAGISDDVINTLATSQTALQGKDRGYEAPFLTNHDMVRVMQQLGGDAPAARLAAATLFALPGTPFIYYGEEIGMQGGTGSVDQDKRTPMRWEATGPLLGFSSASTSWYGPLAPEAVGVDVATQRADPTSLWNRYRRSIALRHANLAFAEGDAAWVTVTNGNQQALALLRTKDQSRALFVANFATTSLGTLTLTLAGTPTVLDAEGLVGTPHASGGTLTIDGLGPRAFVYLTLD
jgi:alpha-amylase